MWSISESAVADDLLTARDSTGFSWKFNRSFDFAVTPGIITEMLDTLKDWMVRPEYNSIDEFRGNSIQHNVKQPVLFERIQFMKYFSNAGY